MTPVSYLALGDSYTIGEQAPVAGSFPYQTIQLLRNEERSAGRQRQFFSPEIVATTGWTTDELTHAIDHTLLLEQYDIVSLLIGVNNQYRGRATDDFEPEFEALLKRAIQFSRRGIAGVFILSIPDWGVTPFAEGRDRETIAKEIDAYNAVCEKIAAKYKVTYIDITVSQRKDGADAEFLAGDGLHPSAKEYAKWAYTLSRKIGESLL
jgi:lysophospholipase L1-like esterase